MTNREGGDCFSHDVINNGQDVYENIRQRSLGAYAKYRDTLLAHISTPEVPSDYVFLHGIINDPYMSSSRNIAALQDKGYAVALTDDPRIHPSSFAVGDNIISVGVSQDDYKAVRSVLGDGYESDLLQSAKSNGVIMFENGAAEDVAMLYGRQPLLDKNGEMVDLSLLYRAYMTTFVVAEDELSWVSENAVDMCKATYTRMYNDGLRPFNIEELYGLSAAKVHMIIENDGIQPLHSHL